eukprot:scaffold4273_cov106-Isochrysis_galbana.AAC.1
MRHWHLILSLPTGNEQRANEPSDIRGKPEAEAPAELTNHQEIISCWASCTMQCSTSQSSIFISRHVGALLQHRVNAMADSCSWCCGRDSHPQHHVRRVTPRKGSPPCVVQ